MPSYAASSASRILCALSTYVAPAASRRASLDLAAPCSAGTPGLPQPGLARPTTTAAAPLPARTSGSHHSASHQGQASTHKLAAATLYGDHFAAHSHHQPLSHQDSGSSWQQVWVGPGQQVHEGEPWERAPGHVAGGCGSAEHWQALDLAALGIGSPAIPLMVQDATGLRRTRSLGGFTAACATIAGLRLDDSADCGLAWECWGWWDAAQEELRGAAHPCRASAHHAACLHWAAGEAAARAHLAAYMAALAQPPSPAQRSVLAAHYARHTHLAVLC
uniref:Uncharacterized protein n=1 Tax=Chlamydomonas leiostraca TaxID=1034604 RepID=A0A7S0R7M1_9CHLO